MTTGPYTTITVEEYNLLRAVVRAAEELTTANGFMKGTATYASLPPWIIARVNHLSKALAALDQGGDRSEGGARDGL